MYGVLVCDDVRVEASGKRLLIGVYGTSIILNVRPALFNLVIYTWMQPTSGINTLECEITVNRTTVHQASLDDGGVGGFMGTIPIQVILEEPRPLKIRTRINGEEWSPYQIWEIAFAENTENLPDEEARPLLDAIAMVRSAQEPDPPAGE